MTLSIRTKQLGQVRPADTTPLELYSPTNRDRCVVHNIIICNTTSSSTTYRIFVDEDGTTVDETTAIAFDIAIPGNTTDLWHINKNLAVMEYIKEKNNLTEEDLKDA